MVAPRDNREGDRLATRGTAVFKQRFKRGSWTILDLSERGLRALGPLNGLDPNKPVDVRVQIGKRHFIAKVRHRWTADGRHGWEVESIRAPSASQLAGILVDGRERRSGRAGTPRGTRFGRLLGGLG